MNAFRRIALVMGGAIAGLALMVGLSLLLVRYFHVDAAERKVRELDATEPDWRWETLQAARPEVPAEENAAPRLIALGVQCLEECPDLPLPSYTLPNVKLGREVRARTPVAPKPLPPLGEESVWKLPAMQKLRAEWRALPRQLRGRIDVLANEEVVSLDPPTDEHAALHAVARLGIADALDCLESGDRAEALTSIERLLNVVRILDDDPVRQSQEYRVELLNETVLLVERYLGQGTGSDAELEQLQRWLESHTHSTRNRASLRGQRWLMHQWMTKLRSGRETVDPLVLQALMPEPEEDSLLSWWAKPRLAVLAAGEHPLLLDTLNRMVAIDRLPLKDQPVAEMTFRRDLDRRPIVLPVGLIEQRLMLGAKARDALCGARTMHALLAVERYRLKHGKWPARLDDCVPAYLEAVPQDPMAERPIAYRVTAEGVMAYCVGNDGKDNGGDEHEDLIYRLWNVDKRGLAAEEETP